MMSELEWLGWEVAAARYLGICPAFAAVLRALVESAPRRFSCPELAERATDAVGRSYGTAKSTSAVGRVYLYHIRSALRDVGLPIPCAMRTGGWWLTVEDAEAIRERVCQSVASRKGGRALRFWLAAG